MAKDKESLEKSKIKRMEIIHKYGIIPTSILEYDPSDKAIDILANKSYSEVSRFKDKSNELYKNFSISGMDVRAGALSRFPQNIGKILIKLYTKEMDIIYDPFAGHNSRMELCYKLNRHYTGIDICKEFMTANEIIKNRIKDLIHTSNISLINCSSNKVNLPDNYADFTITSPPYWDIEYYGDELEQLGNSRTYESFISNLSEHIKENYRILKPDTYCAWFINDFRRKGVFYTYHCDIINLFRKVGFIIHDIIIIDLTKHPIGAVFASQIEERKYLPKRHEYCIIGKK